ncbi:MAG: hypothetical protein V7K97_06920 [Nostoc sp.]|uniref:hypothetical protein n=1 Tax=Nostoc sp. TaxID=1180 RepID=UPI002FF9F984
MTTVTLSPQLLARGAFYHAIWQSPDLRQRIKFRGITMPNIITVLNIADGKASSQRAAMSTTVTERSRSAGYADAVAIDEDTIHVMAIAMMSNNNLREDKKHLRLFAALSTCQSSDQPQQNPDD